MDISETMLYAFSDLIFWNANEATVQYAKGQLYDFQNQGAVNSYHKFILLLQQQYNIIAMAIMLFRCIRKRKEWEKTADYVLALEFFRANALLDSFTKLTTVLLKMNVLVVFERLMLSCDIHDKRNTMRFIEMSSQLIRLALPLLLVFRQCLHNCLSGVEFMVGAFNIIMFLESVDNRLPYIKHALSQWAFAIKSLFNRNNSIGRSAQEEDLQRAGQDCSICLEEYQLPQAIVLACSHVFCKKCLDNLLQRQMYTCPMCRQPINAAIFTDGDTSKGLVLF